MTTQTNTTEKTEETGACTKDAVKKEESCSSSEKKEESCSTGCGG